MKPICVPCQRFFRPKKNGYYFIEAAPDSGDAAPGTAEPERWHPYKVWVGDLYECEGCGARIVSGFGQSHITESYRPDFAATIARLNASQLQVNDC